MKEINELFKKNGHKLLLIFLILFFGANYDNGQVMLLYLSFVVYYFIVKKKPDFVKDKILF